MRSLWRRPGLRVSLISPWRWRAIPRSRSEVNRGPYDSELFACRRDRRCRVPDPSSQLEVKILADSPSAPDRFIRGSDGFSRHRPGWLGRPSLEWPQRCLGRGWEREAQQGRALAVATMSTRIRYRCSVIGIRPDSAQCTPCTSTRYVFLRCYRGGERACGVRLARFRKDQDRTVTPRRGADYRFSKCSYPDGKISLLPSRTSAREVSLVTCPMRVIEIRPDRRRAACSCRRMLGRTANSNS